jgi:competence protein ComEA
VEVVEDAPPAPLLRPSRRRLLAVAWAALSAALAARLAWRGIASVRQDAVPLAVPLDLDLNTAPIAVLMTLPGIGRRRAEAIVLHRVRRGPFARVEDLGMVDGLGPQTVQQLQPFLRVSVRH